MIHSLNKKSLHFSGLWFMYIYGKRLVFSLFFFFFVLKYTNNWGLENGELSFKCLLFIKIFRIFCNSFFLSLSLFTLPFSLFTIFLFSMMKFNKILFLTKFIFFWFQVTSNTEALEDPAAEVLQRVCWWFLSLWPWNRLIPRTWTPTWVDRTLIRRESTSARCAHRWALENFTWFVRISP